MRSTVKWTNAQLNTKRKPTEKKIITRKKGTLKVFLHK